jgi:peptidyl-prolyl cis-trans isomerase C
MSNDRIFLVVLSGLAFSCSGRNGNAELNFRHNKDNHGTAVASFGGDSVTAEELKERFLEQNPIARARYQTLEQRKEYVDGLANFEVLAQEAIRRGMHRDPEVVETAKKVMVQRLLQKEFDEKKAPVTDEEINAYYQKHMAEFVKPESVRLSHIFFSARETEDPALRKSKNKQAEEVLKKVKVLPPQDFVGFGKLAREHSENPTTKVLDGDMRFMLEGELAAQQGPELVPVAKELKQVGDVSGVVATAQGFHILKLQARQPALNLPVNDVKGQIQSRLLYERRNLGFGKFIAELKTKADYKLHESELAKLEVDPQAPTQAPKGPTPGFIPAPIATTGGVR